MTEETSVLRQVLEELSLSSLVNLLPSVIWVDGFPCELRITRRETIYHVEYVDYDIDGDTGGNNGGNQQGGGSQDTGGGLEP